MTEYTRSGWSARSMARAAGPRVGPSDCNSSGCMSESPAAWRRRYTSTTPGEVGVRNGPTRQNSFSMYQPPDGGVAMNEQIAHSGLMVAHAFGALGKTRSYQAQ